MSLCIKNYLKYALFNVKRLFFYANDLKEVTKLKNYDVNIACVGNHVIRTLNFKYRQKYKATDILTFSLMQPTIPGNLPDYPEECIVGDIYLSLPFIIQTCQREQVDLYDRLVVLITHGYCHLMGYDHMSHDQWKLMIQEEYRILSEFNKLNGTNYKPITEYPS